MKINSLILLLVLAFTIPSASQAGGKCKKGQSCCSGAVLKTEKDTVAYAIGVSVAQNLKMQGMDSINIDALCQGMMDVRGGAPKMDAEKANAFLNAYFSKKEAKKFESKKAAGEQFLAENKKKPGVVTLPDGLQYQVLQEGSGPKPSATDKVKTHYHGTLIDGSVFDSSVDRGEPVTFPVNGVIKGWTEALQLMNVGSKWKLFIPSELAYGEQGAGGVIEPYATLIFEVELLSIEK